MKWIEHWYVSYALLGLSAAGLQPILLPLLAGRSGGAAEIGAVMAAFSLGGLTAPAWGGLADRFRMHQWILAGGLAGTAAGAALFPLAVSSGLRAAFAFLSGAGLAASSTVANLFIVETRPREEWDSRIGWLQTFYGGGQVIGLVLAGLIGQSEPEKGMWLASGAAGIAIVPALFGTRIDSAHLREQRPLLSHQAHRAEWPVSSPQHLYHHLNIGRFGALLRETETPFGLFLVAWLLGFSGSAAIFSLYPVLMEQLYGISTGASSAAYAVAAGLGLVLYAPSGRWSERRGARAVFQYGLAIRVVAFAALIVLSVAVLPGRGWVAMLLFLIIVLAWSLLSVSSTTLVASLAAGGEGEAMGVFNAVTALSGVIGAGLGGWLAEVWGYGVVPVVGIAGSASGLLIMLGLSRRGTLSGQSSSKEVHL
jgi:DHA1 family tetracycline resistance protein-like MFS transporter